MDRNLSKKGFSVSADCNRLRHSPMRNLASRTAQARTLLRGSSSIWIAPFKSTAARYSIA